MTNKEETKYLIEEKKSEGKNIKQAFDEIREFNYSQKCFKKMNRENISLKNKIEKLEKQLSKNKVQVFKQLRVDQPKKTVEVSGSIKNITRVLNHMEVNKPYMISYLGKDLMLDTNHLRLCFDIINKCKDVTIIKQGENWIRIS